MYVPLLPAWPYVCTNVVFKMHYIHQVIGADAVRMFTAKISNVPKHILEPDTILEYFNALFPNNVLQVCCCCTVLCNQHYTHCACVRACVRHTGLHRDELP
jgi:hypothetical protein